ncbi:MAG: hypothetical protein KIT87_07015 [Anaerolineae bacterium]|nr:hypothetical protein [Anaerolineae bacterium]
MKRLLSLIALGLVLLVGLPTVSQAQAPVDTSGKVTLDLRGSDNASRCSQDPRETTKICDFPTGTKEINVLVTYQDLAMENGLAVELRDESGNVIFFKSERVTGSGSLPYKVTGTDVYTSYQTQVVAKTDEIINALNTQNASAYYQAATVLQNYEPVISMVRQLERYTAPSTPAQLTTARTRLEAGQAKAQEVKPTGQTAEVQAQLIRDALAATQEAKQQFSAAKSGLQGRTGLAFLNVDTTSGQKMTGKLSRGGQPVESAEWAVASSPIQRATAEPTRAPTSTVAPTINVSAIPPATLTAQVASLLATLAAAPSATLPPVAAQTTPTPLPVEATATSQAARGVDTPVATVPSAITATEAPPGVVPPTATAFRLAGGAATPTVLVSIPTGQASAAAAAIASPTVRLGTTPGATSAAVPGGVGTVAPTGAAIAKAEAASGAQPTPTATTARVAGKVSFNLTPGADGSTRVAGQANNGGLPWATIGLVVVALGLAGAALWMRRRV